MAPLHGLDVASLGAWLSRAIPSLTEPLSYEWISGGHSNLTYVVRGGNGRRFVLRRPPLGDLPPKAHDVLREARIMAALAPTPVPVPSVAATCDDPTVTGAPFYVMAWADGAVVSNPPEVVAALPEPGARRRAGEAMIDALADLHAVSLPAVGLDRLAPPNDYLARILDRMTAAWDRTQTRDVPLMAALSARLRAAAPVQEHTGLVHGDFRMGNVMVTAAGEVAAVLDWELTTVGDVLADVGFLLNSWELPDDTGPQVWMEIPPSRAGGFPTRTELLDRYAARTGFDLHDIAYYQAFSAWRMAVIAEGVNFRYQTGALDSSDVDMEHVARRVLDLADLADTHLRSVGA